MHRRRALAVLLLLVSTSVGAVVDPAPDKVGLYFDETGDRVCEEAWDVFTFFSARILLTHPTMDAVAGFDATLHSADGELLFLDPAPGPGGEITVDGNAIHVRFPTPLPTREATLLAEVDLVYMDGDECLYLAGVDGAAWPRLLLADGTAVEVEPTSFLGNGVEAVLGVCATIIGEPLPCEVAVANKRVSWGGLKARYR
ncbi:MAG TPA: hypothetical protein P5571_06410 [Candidatus Krumholzibacteria bacterium]|nr:hypothetical protein [Candidatus Krumholzibacteria bacterium]HRX50975.1 hypothetical protein [Candidatus Krumholzibacteria bacterium]